MSRTDDFLAMQTAQDLADVLETQLSVIKYFCRQNQSPDIYHQFIVTKKNGKQREIFAPNTQLKYLQKKLKAILENLYIPKKCVHGYVKDRSIVTNAQAHVSKRVVLNLDIENFFPSIHFGRVRGIFKKKPFNFNDDVSLMLAQLTCFRGYLPQGAPTSPILSNFACRTLDNELIKLTNEHKCVYTRYCDDITISTKRKYLPQEILEDIERPELGSELIRIFKNNTFPINKSKIRVQTFRNRQIATGLVINEKPNILNRKYREFRQIMWFTYKHGFEAGCQRNKHLLKSQVNEESYIRFLMGKINYYKMVLGEYSTKYQYLARLFNELEGEDVFNIPDTLETTIAKHVYIVDDLRRSMQGTGFYIKDLGFVTCYHNIANFNEKLSSLDLSKVKIYLPNNPQKHCFVQSVLYENADLDLVILKVLGVNRREGFIHGSVKKTDQCTAVGYPQYAEGNSVTIIKGVQITGKARMEKLPIYTTNAVFIKGASGGPILNSQNHVVGYIDRGNESDDDSKDINISAFASLEPIIEIFDKISEENLS